MIRINHIRLRSFTASRVFGADIPLGAGLNIIQADSTSGKSTCMQAIIYGLGLERSLGPKREVPLPYAMRDRIQVDKDSPYEPVQQSYVMLEVENSEGEIVTTRRDITGGADHRLVQTWSGPLTSVTQGADTFSRRDFFLLDPGAATRTDGFHNFLAAFCGFTLPSVPKFDGSESPLYLETLFPLFFVEQKRGWSNTQGPLPTFLGIQDLARRVMEYILDLDAGKVRRSRAELLKQLAHIEGLWRSLRKSLLVDAGGLVRILGLPDSPTADLPTTLTSL